MRIGRCLPSQADQERLTIHTVALSPQIPTQPQTKDIGQTYPVRTDKEVLFSLSDGAPRRETIHRNLAADVRHNHSAVLVSSLTSHLPKGMFLFFVSEPQFVARRRGRFWKRHPSADVSFCGLKRRHRSGPKVFAKRNHKMTAARQRQIALVVRRDDTLRRFLHPRRPTKLRFLARRILTLLACDASSRCDLFARGGNAGRQYSRCRSTTLSNGAPDISRRAFSNTRSNVFGK